MAATKPAQPKLSGADAKYGYAFGVEGLMSLQAAMDHLDIGRTALMRLVTKGTIRAGRGEGDAKQRRYRVCRRSVLDYCKTLEQ